MDRPESGGASEYQRILGLLDQRRWEEAYLRGRLLLEGSELELVIRARTHNLICWLFAEGLKRPSTAAWLHGEEAVRLAEQAGETRLAAEAALNLAGALYQSGRYENAARWYDQVLKNLEADPELLPEGSALCRIGQAQLDLVGGCADKALERLDSAEAALPQGCGPLLAEIERRRALAHLRLGSPETALSCLERIDEAELLRGPRGLWCKTHLRFTRARVEVDLGHWVTARVLARDTLALARELGDQPVEAECICLLAVIARSEGSLEAYRLARNAMTLAQQSGRRDVVKDLAARLSDLLTVGT